MTAAAAPLGAAEAPVLRVAAAWGTTIVGVRMLERGQSCTLGTEPGALAVMPDELQAPQVPLRAAGGGWELDARGAIAGVLMLRGREENLLQIARSGAPVPVLPGDYGLVQYGLFSIFFQYTTAAQPLKSPFTTIEPLVGLSVFSSVVMHLGIIGLLIINWTPPEYQLPPELVSPEDYAARFGLNAPARRDGAAQGRGRQQVRRRLRREGPRRQGPAQAGRRPEDPRQGGQGRDERQGRPH